MLTTKTENASDTERILEVEGLASTADKEALQRVMLVRSVSTSTHRSQTAVRTMNDEEDSPDYAATMIAKVL